jgi:hypothetical protein
MKIKKSVVIAIVFLLTNTLSFAQFTGCKVADIEALKKSGTLVVAISDDDGSNKATEEIMKSNWTASKFIVIKKAELESYVKKNPENYVLSYIIGNETRVFTMTPSQNASTNIGGRTKSKTVGDGLMLAKNVKDIKKLKPTDAMIYCFLDFHLDVVSQEAEFIRQIGSINSILVFPNLKDNQIGGWKIPTNNHKDVVTKELWVASEDLNKNGQDTAKMNAAYYPYKYKVVAKEQIAKAIIEKKKDVVYLACTEYQVGAYMFIVHSTDDNRALFFMGGTGGLDPKDMSKIKNNKQYGQ